MYLDVLETGQSFVVRRLLDIATAFLPRLPLDIVKILTYRPEFFGTPFCRAGQALMRGSPAIVGWTIGQRELMGAFTSRLNQCEFWTEAHGAVASRAFGPASTDILSDWRAASHANLMDEPLGRTLAVLEALTIGSSNQLEDLIREALQAGVPRGALLSAGYINFGFNVINRVADGLGAAMPDGADVQRAATLLLKIGYRRLSGDIRLFRRSAADGFATLVNDLRVAALTGPARLPCDRRQLLYEGTGEDAFGHFGRTVAERADTISGADVHALVRAGYTEDEVFEGTICAALGASARRLEMLLTRVPPTAID